MSQSPFNPTALNGQTTVVTGATGFVGSRLVRELLAAGGRVVALTRRGGAPRTRLVDVEDRIEWREVDFATPLDIARVMRETEPRFVFHLAGLIDMRADADIGALRLANVEAAANVVRACDHDSVELVVHTGSCAEYGDLRDEATEGSPLEPNTPYGVSKAEASVECRRLANELGVALCVLRPYNLYGEHESRTRLVPHVALSLLAGRPVDLTAGEQAKDYLYVGDLAAAYLAAASAGQRAATEFNIGSGATVSVRSFVERFSATLGADPGLLRFGAQAYRDNEMWYQGTSVQRARDLLEWTPAHSLDEGLALTARWYEQNRALYE